METFDVVIVGAGIAGSALAAALASAGLSVLVLERQVEFRDKVRGEYLTPWGVAEAQKLGLADVLIAAGGAYASAAVGYEGDVDPAVSERAKVPFDRLIKGVRGALCVGHPQAAAALRSHAEQRGASVRSGVGDVEVAAGAAPTVHFELDGEMFDTSSRLIVGADGRQSSVRRGLGLKLHQVTSKATLGGMLVRAPEWTQDWVVFSNVDDLVHFAAPRADGFVRLYLASEPGPRSAGAERGKLMLESFRTCSMPYSAAVQSCEIAGPCAYVAGSDGWTDRPVVDGVVLIGDAAGWSDPLVGQGLAIALRDARMVSEVLLEDDWSPEAFGAYITERAERMSRLKVAGYLQTELRCTFTPEGKRRRMAYAAEAPSNPMTSGPLMGTFLGPETQEAEVYGPENVQRILSLG